MTRTARTTSLPAGAALAAALVAPLFGGAPHVRAQEPPAAEAPAARIARLVGELGHADFAVRERAQKELVAIGPPALAALEQAKSSPDPEVASRAAEAIARIREGGGTRERPRPPAPRPEERGLEPVPEMPDVRDVLRELQRQMEQDLPPGFNELFRDLFRDAQPPGGAQERDLELPGGRGRLRVWSSGPQAPQPMPVPGAVHGVQVGPPSAALRAHLGIDGPDGLVVNALDPQGPLAKAGVQLHDVIMGVDGRLVRTPRDLQALGRAPAKLTLYRRAKLETLDVPAFATAAPPGGTQAPQPPRAAPPKPGESRSF